MSVHESSLTTQDVLNNETFENTLKNSRPSVGERSDSFQTQENTRRNSLQAKDVLPESFLQSPPPTMAIMPEPCQRCSGDGEVAKPCCFCKATGKTIRTQSCVDCEAEKNGCGNMNCELVRDPFIHSSIHSLPVANDDVLYNNRHHMPRRGTHNRTLRMSKLPRQR